MRSIPLALLVLLLCPRRAPGLSALHSGALELHERDAVRGLDIRSARLLTSSIELVVKQLGPTTIQPNSALHRRLQDALLPAGYPQTVPPEYLKFTILNVLQDSCSFLRGIMSMGAILKGLGVGDATQTPAAATTLWILRDGFGMIGSLLFASFVSVGTNAKRWRIFADGINNVGITLEVLAPMLPHKFFLAILGVASVCKALCGVAAGATNAAFLEHWGGVYGNQADVASKGSAQHTVLSLVCICISVPFIKFTGKLSSLQMGLLYGILTTLHMLTNIKAMRIVALRSLNAPRLSAAIACYLQGDLTGMSTRAVANVEPLLFSTPTGDISYWGTLDTLARKCTAETVAKSLELYSKNRGYFIVPHAQGAGLVVCMKHNHTPEDQAKAFFESQLVVGSKNWTTTSPTLRLLEEKHAEANIQFPLFWARIKELNWDTIRLQLRPPNAVTLG